MVGALSSNFDLAGSHLLSWHPSQHEAGRLGVVSSQLWLQHPTCCAGVGAIEGVIEAALAPVHAAGALRRRSPLGRRSGRLLAGCSLPRGCSWHCLATASLQVTTMLAGMPV